MHMFTHMPSTARELGMCFEAVLRYHSFSHTCYISACLGGASCHGGLELFHPSDVVIVIAAQRHVAGRFVLGGSKPAVDPRRAAAEAAEARALRLASGTHVC